WALVAIASGLGGFSFGAYSDEQIARAEAAERAGDLSAGAELWLEVWAPLGSAGAIGRIARDNAGVLELDEVELDLDPPALGRLAEIRAPTLVVVGDRDVPAMLEIADLLAARVSGARKVVLPGVDHMVNYRAPEELARLV